MLAWGVEFGVKPQRSPLGDLLAPFALLKVLAPTYNPWKVFYRMGLNEFLAAYGVRDPSSWTASPYGLAVHEGAHLDALGRKVMFRRSFWDVILGRWGSEARKCPKVTIF